MPSKSIERIPSDFAALRERAIAAELAKDPPKIVRWLRPVFARAAHRAGLAIIFALLGYLWLVTNGFIAPERWAQPHYVALFFALLFAGATGIPCLTAWKQLREQREIQVSRLREAPAASVKAFLAAEISITEDAALGPEAPLTVLRERLRLRYDGALSVCLQVQARAKQRTGETKEELKRHQYRLVALAEQLEAAMRRLDALAATSAAYFAECRRAAHAFGDQLDAQEADRALLAEAARIEDAAETDLAEADHVADRAVARIAGDLTDLRVRYVDAFAAPSETLFVRDGTAALEEDLAAYEALAAAAHGSAANP